MEKTKLPRHIVGNAGVFYVCHRLSQRGWNAMPTTRNAKGPDIVIVSEDAYIDDTGEKPAQAHSGSVRLEP